MSLIDWLVVPAILGTFLIYVLFLLPDEEAPSLVKASARSGKWAGFVILVLFIVSRNGAQPPDAWVATSTQYSFDSFSTGLATVIGFFVFLGLAQSRTSRFLGLLAFALTAATSITLYAYLFISAAHSTVMFWALGLTLGMLLNRMIFPQAELPEGVKDSTPEETGSRNP